MPIVTIQVTREGTTPGADRTTADQKARIFQGITDLMSEILGERPDDTWVVFQEVELDDWGRAGLPVPQYRERAASAFPPRP